MRNGVPGVPVRGNILGVRVSCVDLAVRIVDNLGFVKAAFLGPRELAATR